MTGGRSRVHARTVTTASHASSRSIWRPPRLRSRGRWAIGLVIAAVVATGCTPDPATPSATTEDAAGWQTYRTADRPFRLRVPPGWFVSSEGSGPDGWFKVTLRQGAHLHGQGTRQQSGGSETPHGEPLVTVEGAAAEPGTTRQQLGEELCRPLDTATDPPDCGTTQGLDGTTWSWALIRVSPASRVLAAATVQDGVVYRAAAAIPDGPDQAQVLAMMRRVVQGFRIHPTGNADSD